MADNVSSIRTRQLFWSLIPLAFLFVFTRPDFIGDTGWYAGDIVAYQESSPRAPDLLWEPGHLLWRPLGVLVYRLAGDAAPYPGEPAVRAAFLLVSLNLCFAVGCMLLFQAIGLRIGLPVWLSVVLATGFFSFYTVLEYSRSGTAYVPSLMWLMLCLWLTIRAVDREAAWKQGIFAGLALGLAVLFWAPTLVSSLGIAAAVLFWNKEAAGALLSRRLKLLGCIAAVSLLVVLACYAVATFQLHISTCAALRAWLATSAHGWSQSKQLVRMVSGLPRSFISLGLGGVDLKRYLFHDPYAPVTLTSLLTRNLWKIAGFYLFAACLLWSLIQTAGGQRLLWILVAGLIPVLFVAVFVLESGAPERYLPLYPVLCLSVAYALRGVTARSPAALGVLGFLVVAAIVNSVDLSAGSVAHKREHAVRRLAALQGKLTTGSLLALVSQTDDIYEFEEADIFDPARRKQPLPVYNVIEVASERVVRWKQNFADRASQTLSRGQSVWISKRLLAERPNPAWRWTEGDDRRIAWRDLKPFFQEIQYGSDVGGEDGFVLLMDSPSNVKLLSDFSKTP